MTPSNRAAGAVLAGVAVAGLGALAWGVLVERTRFTVRHEVLPVLPRGARPITILHLSDLHMAPWQEEKQAFIRSLVRYEPDLIVDTGDNLGHADGLIGVKEALEPFEGVAGVFVHGSNDYKGPVFKNPLAYFGGPSGHHRTADDLDTTALELFFEDELGWLDLNNRARAMEIRGTRIEFMGTGDAHRGWDQLAALPGAIDELRENVEWTPGTDEQVLGIGVTHAPYQRVLNSFVNQGADVVFAGHTHGGQVRIPGLPALVTNCDIPRDQAQGLSVWRTAHSSAFLEVSAGLGTSIYAPVRFACPPEAVVLTLVAAEA
ncbi:MAG TPA: metallophosphoesterase [Pseudolysinimonas sp.]